MHIYFDENNKMVFDDSGYVMTGISDPDALSYFARMDVQPTDERKILINNLILGLKYFNLWNSIDILRLYASHTLQAALLNIKGDYWNGIGVNSPTFTIDRGITGQPNGVKHITSDYNVYSGGTMATSISALGLVYDNQNNLSNHFYFTSATPLVGGFGMYNNTLNTYGYAYYTTVTAGNSGNVNRVRFKWLEKTTSTKYRYGDNLIYVEKPVIATTIADGVMRDLYGGDRHALMLFGESITDQQMTDLQGILLDYLNQVGASI